MNSLEIFAKKYNAFVDFSHENRFVQLNLYWNDNLPEVEGKNSVERGVEYWKFFFGK